ncbi:hypothetical protein BHM03_00058501, partial [Ensete ventricosum]
KATRRRGSRAWPDHLQGGDRLQPSPLAKGRPPAGAVAHKWRPPARAAAARGHDRLRPACKGRLPATRLQGGNHQRPAHDQPCRLHRRDGDSIEEGKERARASF